MLVTNMIQLRNRNRHLDFIFTKQTILTTIIFVVLSLLFYIYFPVSNKSVEFFYFTVISCAFLFSVLSQKTIFITNVLPLIFSGTILWLILGLRDISGVDDPTYKLMFVEINKEGPISFIKRSFMEPGYILLNYVFGRFCSNYYIFQGLTSFIPLFFIFKGFFRYRNYIYIPFALLLFISTVYFQMLSTSLIRMFIAISLVYYYSLYYLFNGKPFQYLISIICITLFHYSALIMIIFFPISLYLNWCVNHWKLVIILILTILPILILSIGHLIEVIGGRYAIYALGGDDVEFDIMNLDTVPFIIFALYFQRIIPNKFKSIFIINIIILSFSSILSLLSPYAPFLGRVIFYMNLSLWFILPMIFRFSTKNWLITSIIVIVYSFLYLIVTQFNSTTRSPFLFPYVNIFFSI